MKRLAAHSLRALMALALAGAGAAVALVVWVAASTPGTRWFLESVVPLGGAGFSVQKVEGRMADHLLLTGVRIGLAQQKVALDSIELRWRPIKLLSGTVAIQELSLGGVRIQDNAPPDGKPLVLIWPRLSGNAWLPDVSIARLRITDASYRLLKEQPELVTSFSCSVTWRNNLLSIGELKAAAPSGEISGTVTAGFGQPSLTAELAVALTHPLAEMDRFSLQLRRSSGTAREQLAGTVAVSGYAGVRKLLELGGDVGMERTAFNLRRIRLSSPVRGGVVTAEGTLAFKTPEPLLSLQVKATGLDLAPELNVPTDISGVIRFSGTPESYRGDFTLANRARGWRSATVSGYYHGTGDGMKLTRLNARALDGSLTGDMEIDWRDGLAIQGGINGRNLNPARLAPDWEGVVNFSAAGTLVRSGKGAVSGGVSVSLLESRLHGQSLTGELQAEYAGNNLSLTRLVLQGKGFDLHASGELNRRLALSARISDFSLLVPGAAGAFKGDGWLRWQGGHLSGAVTGSGSALAYSGTQIAAASLTARLDQGAGFPLHVAAALRDVTHDRYRFGDLTVAADGTLRRHTLNATLRADGGGARLALSAGYDSGLWGGEITLLTGRDDSGAWNLAAPAAFAVSAEKFSLSPLALTAGAAERIELSADLKLNPLTGQARAQWSALNLARANAYLSDGKISGSSNGSVQAGFLSGNRLTLTGNAAGSGTFTRLGQVITIRQSLVTVDGSERGIRGTVELSVAGGGGLKGSFLSPAPLRPALPAEGELTAELSGIDLALLKPWLPRDIGVEGRINGRMKGTLTPGQGFVLDGTAVLSGGTLHKNGAEGAPGLAFTSASASWGWRGEALSGTISLAMDGYGQARASFRLPVPARFPVAAVPAGPLQATLTGQFQENGIISALFPETVRKSFGELDAELAVSGSWEAPLINGTLQVTKGGAYLPTAGIRIKEVQGTARLDNNQVKIDSLRARSGPGQIEAKALLTLSGWRLTGYQGTISGKDFQTIHFPELELLTSPELSFHGTPQKLTLRGELRLPELHVVGAPTHKGIEPSGDVVFEGRVVPAAGGPPLALDVQIRLLLGEKVFVEVAGIDARLGGAMELTFSSFDRIASTGEITVTKGRYRTYGVNLDIARGRLYFSGGPINLPTLDFLALRTIGDVKAGVTVAGNIRKPETKLYSEPAMPDVDILAYIVLGHPLGNSEQASRLNQAAGVLLSSSQASLLQDQIKSHLGLSTLAIQEGVGGTASHMGYKPLPVTPPGAVPATQQPGVTETMLTVGKYLTPQLYISYGRSVFTQSNLFLMRYDIFKQWQIETQTGSESGADLFYKLEFK